MSDILATIAAILQTYSYFKNTYRTLQENEVVLREVFDEIFLYEKIIEIYAQKIKDDANLSQSTFIGPIQKFAAGVNGFRSLLTDYSKSKGLIAKAWNFCRTWCCTEQNSRRIKKYTQVPTLSKAYIIPVNHNFRGGNFRILPKQSDC
jgi:hypothetical protein